MMSAAGLSDILMLITHSASRCQDALAAAWIAAVDLCGPMREPFGVARKSFLKSAARNLSQGTIYMWLAARSRIQDTD